MIKAIFAKIREDLKEDIKFRNERLWILGMCYMATTISIIISFFVEQFFYLNGIVAITSIILLATIYKKMSIALSYILYLLPFSMVLKIPNLSFGFYPIIVAVSIFGFGVEWIIQVVKKKRKIQILTILPTSIYILYLFTLFIINNYSFLNFVTLTMGALFLFVVIEFMKDIDIKEIFCSFILGILISCLIGIFYKHYPNLRGFYNITNALGVIRFSALFPNTNAFTMNVLMAIGMVLVLYLKRDLKILVYPVLLLLLIISFETLSKMTYIVLILLLIALFVVKLISDKKFKISKFTYIPLILTIFLSCLIQINNCVLITKRLAMPFSEDQVEINIESAEVDENLQNGEISTNTNGVLNNFTTGRVDLWKRCINEIATNTRNMFFGVQSGRDVYVIETVEGSPHNTFLQAIYASGVLGLILLASILSCYLVHFRKNFDFRGVVLLVAIAGCFCSLDAFSYIGFIMVSMIMISLNKTESASQETIKEGEKENGDT